MTGINQLPTNNNFSLLNSNILHKGGALQNHQAHNHQAHNHQAQNQTQTPQQQALQQTQLSPRKIQPKPQQAIPQQATQQTPQKTPQTIPPQLAHAIRNPISLTPIGNTANQAVILPEVSQIFNQISDLLARNNGASLLKFQQNIPNLQQQNFAQKLVQYLTHIGKGGENYQAFLEGLNLNQNLDKQLKQLFGRLEQLSRQILHDKDGDAWQRIFMPLLSDKQMQFITFYVPYHGQEKPKQNQKQKQEKQENREKQDKQTQRFILSFDFSGTGMIEIDLYMEQEKRIYMVLRTLKKVDAEIQQMMRTLIENVTASMGLDGFLAFQQAPTLIETPLDASTNILCGKIL